ncbi:MAG: PDZ domain-containing protein [Acidobacteria bacterium]|nr:PDZ domain-containing protein [Acidobacteriota bacterium]
MWNIVRAAALAAIFIVPARAQVQPAINRVYPALVRIHVVMVDYARGREQKFEASGSGAIITPEGHVITNHHVAGKATRITVTLSTKEEVEASLIGSDALADIAIIKLDLGARKDPSQPIPVAVFGDSDALRVGDPVLAMGSPLALSQSVTMGIVSNLDMMIPRAMSSGGGFKLDGEDVGSLVKWIGHDAQIFPGNSGGPLVNLKGEIVGINDIGFGLGGAIPGNLAKQVAAEIRGRGEVRRSWTGLELQPLLKGNGDQGVLVSGVIDGSPAARAGIQAGDIMLSYDRQPLAVRFYEQIPPVNRMLLQTPIGKQIEVVIRRDRAGAVVGERKIVELTTELRPKVQGREIELRSWGLTGCELTPLVARELQRTGATGALVTSVRPGGPAAEAKPPIAEDDVVVEVRGQKVESLDALVALTDAIAKGMAKPVPALVAFERGDERFVTVVKLGPAPPEERSMEAQKAWFPAGTQVLTAPLAEALGLSGKAGVRVTQVYPGTAVEAAGIQVGDIVLAIDGEPIPATQPEDVQVLPAMVRQRKIGSKAELTIVRAGKELEVEIELPARPPEGKELPDYKNEPFEFTVREIAFKDRVENQWPAEVEGALVSSVETGGWAALANLKVGDLILAVDSMPIPDVKSLTAAMEDVAKRRPAWLIFQVRRGIHTMFVELEPTWRVEP